MESGAVAIEDKNESKKLYLTMMGTLRDLKAADTELMMNLGTDDGAPLSPRLRRALQNGTATHITGTKVPIGSLDVHGGRYAIPRCALMPVVAAGAPYFTSPKAVVQFATERAKSKLYASAGPLHHHVAFEKDLLDNKEILVDGRAVGAFEPFFTGPVHSKSNDFLLKWTFWKKEENKRRRMSKFSGSTRRRKLSTNSTLMGYDNDRIATENSGYEWGVSEKQQQRRRLFPWSRRVQPWQVVAPSWTLGSVSCAENAERASKLKSQQKVPPMDRPWALYGDENSGWLSLRFQVTTPDTPVIVCEPPCSLEQDCPQRRGSLRTVAQFQLGKIEVGRSYLKFPDAVAIGKKKSSLVAPSGRMLVDGGHCFEIVSEKQMEAMSRKGPSTKPQKTHRLMKGEYVLRIRVLPKGHLSQQYVLVSHLVWF